MRFGKAELEDLYAAQGWNESRLRRSFSNKQELILLSGFADVEAEGLVFEVSFEQTRKHAYGFAVHVCVELAQSKDRFLAYLFIEGARRPLHKPVEIPIKYGFTAQANQLLTAVVGLRFVYNVAGVEGLEHYPMGMASW